MSFFNFFDSLGERGRKQAGRFLRLFLVLLMVGAALWNVSRMEQSRYTFVFYGMKDKILRAEERMIPNAPNQEDEIRRYVEETLLGPQNPASVPLFLRETKLLSFLYQEETAYINLSEFAAMPLFFEDTQDDGALDRVFSVFRESIKRNFPFIKEIKFFIEGHSLDEKKI